MARGRERSIWVSFLFLVLSFDIVQGMFSFQNPYLERFNYGKLIIFMLIPFSLYECKNGKR